MVMVVVVALAIGGIVAVVMVVMEQVVPHKAVAEVSK